MKILVAIILAIGLSGCANTRVKEPLALEVYACIQADVTHKTNLNVMAMCQQTLGCQMTPDFVLKMFNDAIVRDRLCQTPKK